MFSSSIEYKSVNKKRGRGTLFFYVDKRRRGVYNVLCACGGERVLEMLTKKYKKIKTRGMYKCTRERGEKESERRTCK